MKHFWITLIVVCFTYFIFFTNASSQKEHEIEILLGSKNKSLESSYKAVSSMYQVSIENYFKYVIMQPAVLEILKKRSKSQ